MDITDAAYPREINGNMTKPVSGKSLLPIFRGEERTPHSELYWQFGQAKAVRQGDWKLVRLGKAPWELYNLKTDKTELNDIAGEHPEKTRELTDLWANWYTSCKEKP